ncbi:hypothetical protein [uncultured Chryseobacterium sp.]|uniref:hypothetical protein n=1 Tax=uncultured Chryseobacterium sp. TaxID=259322 RepID=UPI0025D6B1FC|nr:hypothetical protein [uncultured Chryseobacterium sp.]
MKYTEEQILAKAQEIMKDLDSKSYFDNCIDGVFFEEKRKIISGNNKGKICPVWVVRIISSMDNSDFLIISDETGEPLIYQNFNTYISI